MTITPSLWADLEQVNTGDLGPNGGDQEDPGVVGLANGNFLVVYDDDSDANDSLPGDDILGRLYDALGNPLGSPFALNQLRTGDDEVEPDVAALSDGGFVLVYEGKDANGTSLIYETYGPEGEHKSSGFVQNDLNDDVLRQVEIDSFQDDSFVASYTRLIDGGNSTVAAKIVDADGKLSEEIPLHTSSSARAADVAVTGADSFVAAFVVTEGQSVRIEYRGHNKAGAFQFGDSIASPGAKNVDPQVTALGEDQFLVVWTEQTDPGNEQVYGQIFNSQTGAAASGLLDIASDGDDDKHPSVAALPDGGFMVLYEQQFSPGNSFDRIIGQRFDSRGEKVGEELLLDEVPSTESVEDPEVALLSDGRIVGVWEQRDDESDIEAQIWDPRSDSIVGGTADEVITGLQAPSTVDGQGGDDTIFGVSGNDWLYGSSGHDRLYGDRGFDRLYGQEGNDFLDGGSGKDRLFGGSGADTMVIEPNFAVAKETYDGGSGVDRILLRDGASLPDDVVIQSVEALAVRAGTGDDSLGGSDFLQDILFGGSGNDDLRGGTGFDSLFGGFGIDTLRGNDGEDYVYGGKGTDRVFGHDGEDVVYGGGDSDRLSGGSANDLLVGNAGRDFLNGNSGVDRMFGGTGNDTFVVDTLTDVVYEVAGGGDADLVRSELDDYTLGSDSDVERGTVAKGLGDGALTGNTLDNVLTGNTGDNSLSGGKGSDLLRGQNGNDHLNGDDGMDTLRGGGGDDFLEGGVDTQVAGAVGDTFMGQKGNDTISLDDAGEAYGGAGDDRFLFDGDEVGNGAGRGGPSVHDFHGQILNAGAEQDSLVFAKGMEQGTFEYRGDGAFTGKGNSEARFDGNGQMQVDHDGDEVVDLAFRIEGMSEAGQLTAQDFVWL